MSSQGKPKRPSGARPLRPRHSSQSSIDVVSRDYSVHTAPTGDKCVREQAGDVNLLHWSSSMDGMGSPKLNTIDSAFTRMRSEQTIEEEAEFSSLVDGPPAGFTSPTSTLLSESISPEVAPLREREPSFFSTLYDSPKALRAQSLPLSASPPPSRPPSRASEASRVVASPPPKSSRAHWARLRQAVLPSSFPVPSPRLPTDESSPSSFRPSTPSSNISSQRSRFPKLGFRGAVEQLRANTKTDAQRVFESEIETICSAIRSAVASVPDLWSAQRSVPYPVGSASGLARFGRGLRRPP